MDPNMFYLDNERLFEVLFTIVILSFFVERALSVLFESRPFIRLYDPENLTEAMQTKQAGEDQKKKPTKKKGVKEFITVAVSVAVCVVWQFDALSIIMVSHEEMQGFGYFITGSIIAGGSKGSLKLFRDVMNFKSSAEAERQSNKENGQKGS